MHTNIQSVSRKHRLYIALPLFAGALFVSSYYGSQVLSGSVSTATEVEIPEVGTQLIASRTLMEASIKDFRLTGWNGAFDVTPDAQGIAVAALTTPVVVSTEDNLWIVPVAMQLHIAGPTPSFSEDADAYVATHSPTHIPGHYLKERLPIAKKALEGAFMPEAPVSQDIMPLGALRLASAQKRAEELHRRERIADVYSALTGEGDALRLLTDSVTIDAFQSGAGFAHIPTLLTLAVEKQVEGPLLQFFMSDPTQYLIALFHPLVQDQAWVLGASQTDMLTQLLLPLSDTQEQAVSELAVQRMGERLEESFDPATVNAFLPRFARVVTSLHQDGYPERAQRYATALAQAYAKNAYKLDDTARTALDSMAQIGSGGVPVTDPVTLPKESAEDTVVTAEPEELEPMQRAVLAEQTRGLLQEYGAMFTSRTAITANPDGRVVVDGIVLATQAGDIVLRFTYNAQQDLVEDIMDNGQTLPYSLPLQNYLNWVKLK